MQSTFKIYIVQCAGIAKFRPTGMYIFIESDVIEDLHRVSPGFANPYFYADGNFVMTKRYL